MTTDILLFTVAVALSLPVAALAVYRIARLLIEDTILETPREKFFNRFPPESSKLGYLFTCFWCLSLWLATLVTIGLILIPSVMLIICLPFAISAIVGMVSER